MDYLGAISEIPAEDGFGQSLVPVVNAFGQSSALFHKLTVFHLLKVRVDISIVFREKQSGLGK